MLAATPFVPASQPDFHDHRLSAIIEDACERTRFVIDEASTGIQRVDDGCYFISGMYENRRAWLKISQTPTPENDPNLIETFNTKNLGSSVRMPKVLFYEPFERPWDFGITVVEDTGGQSLIEEAMATRQQMRTFADFYGDYRARSLMHPAGSLDPGNSVHFVIERLCSLRDACVKKGFLARETFEPLLLDFIGEFAIDQLQFIPRVYSIVGLTAEHIKHKMQNGCKRYVIYTNFQWEWQPIWYDLAFNAASVIMKAPERRITTEQIMTYIDEWMIVYGAMPMAKDDRFFPVRIRLMLLFRFLSILMGEVGQSHELDRDKRRAERIGLVSALRSLYQFYANQTRQYARKLHAGVRWSNS